MKSSIIFHKKGQVSLNMLQVFAILITSAAIVMSISGTVLEDVQKQASTQSKSVSVNLSSGNNNTFQSTTIEAPCGILTYLNETLTFSRGTRVNTSQYKISNSTNQINISLEEGLSGNHSAGLYFNSSYTWYCTSSYNASQKGMEATNTFADWLDTIALVLVAVIVIGLVSFFGRSTGTGK